MRHPSDPGLREEELLREMLHVAYADDEPTTEEMYTATLTAQRIDPLPDEPQ